MKLAYISQAIIFLSLQFSGMLKQIHTVIKQSDSGEFASILNLTDLFSSPVPIFLLQYAFIAVFTTILFIVSQAHFAIFLSHKIKNHISNEKHTILLWAVISNSALLIANSAWFIHTQHFSELFYTWPPIHLNTYACLIVVTAPLVFYIWQHRNKALTRICLLATTAFLTAFISTSNHSKQEAPIAQGKKPHIIIIGIDSLRSDLLPTHMPFLNKQLTDTVLFNYAYTPLGRTFPSWNSILSGLYPVNHGARINLIDESHLVQPKQYLGNILKEEGYKTIFAMDETRFANMGAHQGFNHVISPRVGASDFLIGGIADYPLTNLLSLLPISSWLLPEIYANRGAATTYRAEAFSELLQRNIPMATQPSLLAVHFCLAHWPYRFASKFKPEFDYPEPYYPANLRAVDQQIKSLMDDLQKKGYLENSRIVFLSDHGETWVQESPVFNNLAGENSEHVQHHRKEYGHGSSLISNSSTILLGLKGFSQVKLANNSTKMVSLADIKPTILEELNIQDNSTNDGISLLNTELPNARYIPIETGTVLNVNDEDELDIARLVKEMLNRYQLNPDGLIRIQQEKVPKALDAKLKGIRTINSVLSQHDNNSFRLFDLPNSQFEHFNDFSALSSKHPEWANAWCTWYKQEDVNCSTLRKFTRLKKPY